MRRWQWVVIAVAVGLVLGWARRASLSTLSGDGMGRNGQRKFEEALLEGVAPSSPGRPHLVDAAVYRSRLPDGSGGTREAHVVTGMYYPGHPERVGGELKPVRRRAFFVTWDVPYVPRSLPVNGQTDSAAAALGRFRSVEAPTVVDYLRYLSAAHGVRFTHRWWDTYALYTVPAASVLVIGVLWPTAINLLAFGTLRRPREEKPEIDLSKVRSTTPATDRPPAVTDNDLEQLRGLEEQLEAGLAADAAPPGPPPAGLPGPSVRQLAAQPVAAQSESAPAHKAFGADQDDFYPTEHKARKRGGEARLHE